MAYRNVYYDTHGNGLEAYINADKECFVEISRKDCDPTMYITLDYEDLRALIIDLSNLQEQIKNP